MQVAGDQAVRERCAVGSDGSCGRSGVRSPDSEADTLRETETDGRCGAIGVIVYAYREFEQRVGEVALAAGGKSQSVRDAISALQAGETFTSGDLERICPAVSRATIRRVLDTLRADGKVVCLGSGRNAQWRREEM